MVENNVAENMRMMIKKLNKQISELRSSESEIMGLYYGGDATSGQTLRELRAMIANLERVIEGLNAALAGHL